MHGISFEKFQRWSALCLLNFSLVAILGMILRFKIAFSLPAINYNFLLEAHSHFAFCGWISTVIFTALTYILFQSGYPVTKVYTFQFRLAQTSSFGMLLSFSFEGYGTLSIFFSVLFILFSWWFALQYWVDASKSQLPFAVKRWVKAGLFFFVLSSAGIFALAYFKSHRVDSPFFYFNALYLFLHFQYNGWFSFGVLALFFYTVQNLKTPIDENKERLFFGLMVTACIPAYCLSLLWMNPPVWIITIAALSSILQLGAQVIFLLLFSKTWTQWALLCFQVKLLWGLSLVAFMIKLILQVLCIFPVFGRLAFGFRPVVIAYLHLVMLGFISFYLIGFLIKEKLLSTAKRVWKSGLLTFIIGVIFMEVLLLVQALLAINDGSWSFSPILLSIAATIIFGGVFLMLIAQLKLKIFIADQMPISD
jgi:hypothetical protein